MITALILALVGAGTMGGVIGYALCQYHIRTLIIPLARRPDDWKELGKQIIQQANLWP